MNTNDIGTRTEGACLGELVKLGYSVLVPFGVARYDLVVDTPAGFKRLQCKTGRLVRGAIEYNATTYTHSGGRQKYSDKEVDIFLVYCSELDTVYWIPYQATPLRLRVDPPKNNQVLGVKWAKDYLVPPCKRG